MSETKSWRGVGVMTGTSMDGIDLVCATFEETDLGYTFDIEASATVPMDDTWRARLVHLPKQNAETFAKTHVYFGHYLGKAIAAFVSELASPPDFVASHGQTIFHQPQRSFTAQIGDGETIASYLPCPLITNFRNKDLALKGEGAPLVPIGEKHLFPNFQLFLNLGGIANLTSGHRAFDIAPCNLILNQVFRDAELGDDHFDRNGEVAASGQVDSSLLHALDGLKYYRKPPPKSLGWEWISEEMLPILMGSDAYPEDQLHTLCRHIAGQIAQAIYRLKLPPQPMMVTGGGRHHRYLMACLRQAVEPLGIEIPDLPDDMIDAKEALIFAFLGLRCLRGQPTTLASVTGASKDAVTGAIHLPPQGGWQLVSTAHS